MDYQKYHYKVHERRIEIQNDKRFSPSYNEALEQAQNEVLEEMMMDMKDK